MKFLLVFVLLVPSSLFAFVQNPAAVSAETGSPALFEKDGAGVAFGMAEDQYQKLMAQLAKIPAYIKITRNPKKLTSQALYGTNLTIGAKNISWILDGNETSGYVFYADWNADGDMTNETPVKVKKTTDGKYFVMYGQTIVETVDNRKQKYAFNLKIEITKVEPPGETVEKPALKFWDKTIRRGVLNVDGRKLAFGLVGTGGIYDGKYNSLYFDVNGDNDFDIKNRYSAERYKVPEKYINIDDRTYEYVVDRYGSGITLTPVEKQTARVDLSRGYEAPDFSFKDIAGNVRKLSEFRGKVVLLDFWGTWCGPCVADAPDLAATYKKLKERGFEIISVDKGDSAEELRKFVDAKEMTWTHTMIEDQLSELYRIDRYPTYFLIGKDGRIVANDLRAGEKLNKTVEDLLGN